jgi:putative oxidoreductase
MDKVHMYWKRVVNVLEPAGDWVALLPIRLLMAYEFGSAGLRKMEASETWWGDVPGWFENSLQNFPFPISLFPASFNWFMVTWVEILGGLALVLGLFTRFWAFSLIIITWVAILGVHWPDDYSSLAELWKGYVVSDDGFGNYRIPLLFLVMLLPLVFRGAGKLSLDHLLAKRFR